MVSGHEKHALAIIVKRGKLRQHARSQELLRHIQGLSAVVALTSARKSIHLIEKDDHFAKVPKIFKDRVCTGINVVQTGLHEM
jgi:hypothetical protein